MKYLLDCLLHVDPMVPFLKPPFSLLETKFLVDLYTVTKTARTRLSRRRDTAGREISLHAAI